MVRRTCTPHPNLFIFPKRLANGAYDNNNIHGSHTLQLVRTYNQQKISKIVESQIPIYRPPFLPFPIFSFTFHKCYSRGLFPPLYRLFLSFPFLSFPFLNRVAHIRSALPVFSFLICLFGQREKSLEGRNFSFMLCSNAQSIKSALLVCQRLLPWTYHYCTVYRHLPPPPYILKITHFNYINTDPFIPNSNF